MCEEKETFVYGAKPEHDDDQTVKRAVVGVLMPALLLGHPECHRDSQYGLFAACAPIAREPDHGHHESLGHHGRIPAWNAVFAASLSSSVSSTASFSFPILRARS